MSTPTHSRVMSPAWGSGMKLTPSTSPYLKTTPQRSPTKHRSDVNLALRQVIGTTTSSANAFDTLPSASSFAFCAGAAAVLATVDDEGHVSQRFFRARPTTNPINPSASIYGGPSTPTQNESRNRIASSLREAGVGTLQSSPGHDWKDSPGGKAWSARERIKAATCVSFSPDGKLLAVGETGYKPRVLIFSTAPDAPSDTPLTALSDHTFGVKCLAFSPDGQFLASLGFSTDGFLYVWSINSRSGVATLHASNKCTSNINRMAWMGNSLVTVGTRHVKVWRVEETNSQLSKARQSDTSFLTSSIHKTLPGRNCLLENLLEANFIGVVAIAPSKAVVASDKGYICLIDDSDGTQRFSKVVEAGVAVTSIAVDAKERLHVASIQGGLKTISIKDAVDSLTPPPSPPPPPRVETPTICLTSDADKIEAIGTLQHHLVTVDSRNSIQLSRLCAPDDESQVGEIMQKLPAHGDPVLGVASLSESNALGASFCTWSSGGTILFWSHEGTFKEELEVPLEQAGSPEVETNELKTVTASSDATLIATGDKYGVFRIIDRQTQTSVFNFKAHANEITDVALFERNGPMYIATSARDRMIQVFQSRNGSWDLMQTLDEHVGAMTGILFSRNGERLVSMSSDRTLVVRELASREEDGNVESAFLMLRTVVLKSSPVSMVWDVDQDDVVVVSTIDRHIHKFDLRNGRNMSSFRASDGDGGDAVVLSSLVHIPRMWGSPLIAGVSSTDKSVRLYEENGTLVAREWGHTEGVRDIALLGSDKLGDEDSAGKSLVTVAVDGTIFVWGLQVQAPSRQHMSSSMDLLEPTTPTGLLANKLPVRRVFSQSELANFKRSEEDQGTPTCNRSPKLRKKLSKFSLAQTPKLDASPVLPLGKDGSIGSSHFGTARRANRNRSPSPPSPRHQQVTKRRSSVDVRARPKSAAANEFGSLGSSTESLCRTLRAYRKRLATSADGLSSDLVGEVERELALTARAVGEKARWNSTLDESVITKLLDQYSERLVSILDEKISASVALHVRGNSESGMSGGLPSPALPHATGTAREESSRGCDKDGVSRMKDEPSQPDTAPGADVSNEEKPMNEQHSEESIKEPSQAEEQAKT